jgi:signal transduction histidine kinase
VVDALVGVYRAHDAARGRALVVDPASGDATVATSRVLLTRVAGNMIKNALEAERRGATVVVGCGPAPGGGAALWVRNPTPMPREVQLQVFQRSFSTKDPARGLGAYSMKLLTERYLGGTVSFSSDAERGTEFRVVLPAAAPPPSRPKS